jgi:hypothetical protein
LRSTPANPSAAENEVLDRSKPGFAASPSATSQLGLPTNRNGKLRRFAILAGSNHRETGKNCKCAAIMIVFRRNPGVVLSYQACPIPRILRASDMPVCGDRQPVIIFDPAETTRWLKVL